MIIPHELRDDVVQAVALRLIVDAEPVVDALASHPEFAVLFDPSREGEASDALRDQADAVTEAYLRRMLANQTVDELRKTPTGCLPLDQAPPSHRPEAATGMTPALDTRLIAQTRSDLVRLIELAVTTFKRSTDGERFKADALQLVALSDDAVEFETLVEGECPVPAEADPREREAAAARLYKRHERVRERLTHTLDERVHELGFGPERREALARVVRSYLRRCQNTGAAPVSRPKDERHE